MPCYKIVLADQLDVNYKLCPLLKGFQASFHNCQSWSFLSNTGVTCVMRRVGPVWLLVFTFLQMEVRFMEIPPDLFGRAAVSSGLLPGAAQNDARAELYAVLQAVLTAESGYIYSDSLSTVQSFCKLQETGFLTTEWLRVRDYDLWSCVHFAICDDPWRWKIQWVPSHKEISTAASQHQAWCI